MWFFGIYFKEKPERKLIEKVENDFKRVGIEWLYKEEYLHAKPPQRGFLKTL